MVYEIKSTVLYVSLVGNERVPVTEALLTRRQRRR